MANRRIIDIIGILGGFFFLLEVGFAKVKVDAAMRLGAQTLGVESGEPRHELDLTFKSNKVDGYRAEGKISARYEEAGVVTEWLRIKKDTASQGKIEFGYIRKRMGLEYEFSSKNRDTPVRSYLYRQLKRFSYVGLHTGVRYKSKDHKISGSSMSLGASQSQDASFIWKESFTFHDISVKNWLLLQRDHIENDAQLAYADILSISQKSQKSLWEVELFYGLNPLKSELENTYFSSYDVHFYAMKARYGFYTGQSEYDRFLLLLQGSLLVLDDRTPEVNSRALMLGVNYLAAKNVRFSFMAEMVYENSMADLEKRVLDESRIVFESRLDF